MEPLIILSCWSSIHVKTGFYLILNNHFCSNVYLLLIKIFDYGAIHVYFHVLKKYLRCPLPKSYKITTIWFIIRNFLKSTLNESSSHIILDKKVDKYGVTFASSLDSKILKQTKDIGILTSKSGVFGNRFTNPKSRYSILSYVRMAHGQPLTKSFYKDFSIFFGGGGLQQRRSHSRATICRAVFTF